MEYFFIVNPKAGGGKCANNFAKLSTYLDGKNIPYSFYFTKGVGDATAKVKEEYLNGRRAFIAVGGDGTVNEVVNGIAPHFFDTELGVIPLGTGNDFAYPVGIPKDAIEAFRLIAQGRTIACNLMLARNTLTQEERYAVSFITSGIDLQIVRFVNSLKKKKAGSYNRMLLKAFLCYKGEEMTIDGDAVFCGKSYLIAFSNTGSVSSGMRISQSAGVDNEKLSLLLLPFCGKVRALMNMLAFRKNKFEQSKGVISYLVSKVGIRLMGTKMLDIDGELVCGETFEIFLLHKTLNLFR